MDKTYDTNAYTTSRPTKRTQPPRPIKGQLVGLTGNFYMLESKAFSSGGEGDIFNIVGDNSQVVKIYHPDRISSELEQKLKYMASNPPVKSVLNQVAWPMDVVYDEYLKFKGFVMPKLDITAELGDVYKYPPSKPESRLAYNYKIILAINICTVINAVHNAGYVFGDFNPRNIGINMKTGRVAFLDTDSYHIVIDERANKAYRCKVCLDGYVAPELLKQCEAYKTNAYENAPLPTFTKETDNFALAIHIFKLLMNGYTPFNGIKENETVSTASPGQGNQAIKRDNYCFKAGNKPQAVAVPPATILSDKIKRLFDAAFIDGRNNPKKRPNAQEWYSALSEYEKVLVGCSKNPSHLYKKGLSSCPWCEADERYQNMINPPLIQRTFPSPVILPATTSVSSPLGPTGVVGTPKTQAAAGSAMTSSYVQPTPKKPILSTQTKKRISKISLVSATVIIAVAILGGLISNIQKQRNSYMEAVALLEQENYDRAIWLLDELGNYKDSRELLTEARELKMEQDYVNAMYLLTSGDYEDASAAFSVLVGYKDSSERYAEAEALKHSSAYSNAENLLAEGKKYEAALAFYALGEYQDAREKCFSCWSDITERNTVSAGGIHSKGFTLGVKSNGTVVSVGNNNYNQCEVSDWKDIVAVAAGMYHSVGLRSDGTVVAVGSNDNGECNVSNWSDIVSVSAYYHTVGLKADGTVVAIGSNANSECDVSSWRNIIAVVAGYDVTIGLQSDGTVVTTGNNRSKYPEISDWTNIVTICHDLGKTFGLHSDGTITGVGPSINYNNGWLNWNNIVDIAHGCLEMVGLQSDGTTVSTARAFSGWTNILMIDGRSYHIVGLRNDGTVIAAGNNENGQCNVGDWSDIMLPNQ